MKTQHASADLWDRANKKTSARHGIGAPADAFSEVIPIHRLVDTVASDPEALSQLARRSGELTEEQRRAALKAYKAPKEPKVRNAAKVKPKAAPPAARGMSGISLWGKHGAPRT